MHSFSKTPIGHASPNPIDALTIKAFTLTNAYGVGIVASLQGALKGESELKTSDFPGLSLETALGRIPDIESHTLPTSLADFDARNNRIIDLTIDQDNFRSEVERAKRSYGADRIGVILGTSTSGILETERAYCNRDPVTGALPDDFRYRQRQNTSAPAAFVQNILGLSGPAWVISTACSSSSKVFGAAYRLLNAHWCDAVIVGGADSLCLTTLYGFAALDLVATTPSRPMDRHRNGISIGEAAGFMLLERSKPKDSGLFVTGYGESSDAYHMSTPHPEGLGAARAISDCLARGNASPESIDFVLLHGTGTPANDSAEDRAVTKILGEGMACASIKGAIGHTLGAAGISNAVITCLALQHDFLPGTANLQEADPSFSVNVLKRPRTSVSKRIITNSFGFGGSNTTLLFERR